MDLVRQSYRIHEEEGVEQLLENALLKCSVLEVADAARTR